MKSSIWFLALALIILLPGCGDDGADGDAYLRITWMYSPFAYDDNNPNIPDIILNGHYYRCCAGSYYFEYISWDDSYWYGYYTLRIHKGEKGKFLTDGDDGADRYFTLQCYSVGVAFYELKPLAPEPETGSNNYDLEFDAGMAVGAAPALASIAKQKLEVECTGSGPVYRQTIVSGPYTLELVYQKGER